MSNIEKKESYIEELRLKEKKRLEKGGVLKNYGGDIRLVDYGNIYGVKGVNGKENVIYFIDNKGNFLFQIPGTIRDFGYWKNKKEKSETGIIEINKILRKIGYKFEKDKSGYYHIIETKTNKEISQESLRYYEIFETLANVKDRLDVVGTIFDADETNKKTPEGSIKEFGLTLLKEANKILVERWIKSGVIKPFEINYLHHQKQLSDQETKKYLKQTLTFEYLSNLINNQAIDLVGEQGSIPVILDGKTYKITFGPITKQELDYYKAKNWINNKMYEELLKILEEHKKLEERKEQEEKKHKEEVKKKISRLENDVTRNLG